MTKLDQLYAECGQSPWIDNLRRDWIVDGTLQSWVAKGVRGVTSNPTIFQKAMAAGDAYDEQFRSLLAEGTSVPDAYWIMVKKDIADTLGLFRPLYDRSEGGDGFVSLELAPDQATDTQGSIDTTQSFHRELDAPNLLVKIPGTAEGVPAVQASIAAGLNVNITLIFSLERYSTVMEAYLTGLEAYDGDLSRVHSVASFFVSRVDTEIDRRLEAIGTDEALALRGKGAVAQAKLAYRQFREVFSGPRWEALAARGARLQRPLWASTSVKNPDYPATLYVDPLIGPDTVNTMPEGTLETFEEQGTVASTVEDGVEEASTLWERLGEVGVDTADVGRVLEEEGVAAFSKSFDELLTTLEAKAADLR